MADQDPTSPSGETQTGPAEATNGATEPPRQSLREIAEAAYDQLTEGEDAGGQQPEAGQEGPARDSLGRFAPKDQTAKPGEAAPQDGTQPRVDQNQQPEAHPAPQVGSSSEPPANWSTADRETFTRLPPEGQAFLLRRHSEMEGDYQRRVQQVRGAADFTEALAPVFNEPVLAASMQQSGMTPYAAIREWAGFHRRALSPNPEDRVHLLFDLAARMQIDPAVFAPGRSGQGLSEQDLKDPAIKFFADHIGRTSTEVQTLRAQLHDMQQRASAEQSAEALRVTRWGIDAFADEKGPDGRPLRPDFDQVLDQIIELFRVNPQRDMREAYETARWMVPATRQALLTAERQGVEQKQANQRAAQAVRSNIRGLTSPVSKPAGDGKPQGLRATIEQAADEIGLN